MSAAERVERVLRSHQVAVDVVGAALLLAGAAVFGWAVHAQGTYFLFSVLLVAPLAVRRRYPVACLVAVAAAALLQWLTVRNTVSAVPADVAVPIAVHAVAAYGPVRAARLGLAGGGVGAVLGAVAWPRLLDSVVAHLVIGALLASTVVAAWAVGSLQRVRRVQVEQRAELAVLAERTRIAREMHDVVAHSLAVVIAQADGGRYAADQAMTALATIGQHAREALAETRHILGVLRSDGERPVEPAPGLDELAALLERVRTSGQVVSASLESPPYPVDAGLGLTVYRIVQEGLTNVMKHAGPGARAAVSVQWTHTEVRISVSDDGTGPVRGEGHGILGMRERVAVYGGKLELNTKPGGGSLLTASIPVEAP